MLNTEFDAEDTAQRRSGTGVPNRWWHRRDIDLVARMAGAAIAAAGVLILYLFRLNIGRYSSGLLAFILGFGGAWIIVLGAILVVFGIRYRGHRQRGLG